MKRAIQTVADVPAPQERWKALNEIDAVSIESRKSAYSCAHKLEHPKKFQRNC